MIFPEVRTTVVQRLRRLCNPPHAGVAAQMIQMQRRMLDIHVNLFFVRCHWIPLLSWDTSFMIAETKNSGRLPARNATTG